MTAYRERQEQTDRFYDGEELLVTFRGVGKKVVEASKRFSHEHWRIQKVLSDSAIYAALRNDLIWSEVADVMGDLATDVRDNPRAYCSPPDIPDDWDSLRKVLGDYAPADWWFQVLNAHDFCKDATWRSTMSRPHDPKWIDDIRARVRDWRSRVLQGLDRWEVGVKERRRWDRMIDFRVKDALDAHGEEAAFDAFRHLHQFDPEGGWEPIKMGFYFDPTNPDGPQFEFVPKREDDVRAAFRACVDAGFPRYRDKTLRPTETVVVRETLEFASDDFQHAWQSVAEIEKTLTWDSVTRDFDVTRRVRRVRVKAAPRHAVEGEAVQQDRIRVRGSGGLWEEQFQEYVWRWRPFDPDHDTLGGVDGREVVMRICGLSDPDAVNTYFSAAPAPIEDVGGYSVD